MSNFPQDIYTEPRDVDVNTLANLGPLREAPAWPWAKDQAGATKPSP